MTHPAVSTNDSGPRRRIVVVDDDAAYLRAVRRALSAHKASYDVALWSSADAALEHLGDDDEPDLVVMDVFMPGTNGIEACRRMKQRRCRTKIVLVSSHLTPEVADAAINAGADSTISKPYDVMAVLQAVRDEDPPAVPLADGTNPALPRPPSELVSEHLEMARNIARGLARRYGTFLPPDDIDSLATLGLCEAAARFDSSRTEPFLAFAVTRIRGAVLDEIRRLGSQSRGLHRRARKISQARRAITSSGEVPTDEAVALVTGLRPDEIAKTAERRTRVNVESVDVLPSLDATPDQNVELAEVLRLVRLARDVLPPLEATVIAMRYDQNMSVAAIARALDITVGRVVQLRQRAIDVLRDSVL